MEVIINGVHYVEKKVPVPHCLNERQWEALAKAEEPLYRHGDLGITDTADRRECDIAADIWSYVELAMDVMFENEGDGQRMAKIANRVARVFGVMAFGPDWLIR